MKHLFTSITTIITSVLVSSSLSAQTFSWGGPSTVITLGSPIILQSNVSNVGILNSAEGKSPTVSFSITHTYCGDLDITLTSPEGTTIILTSDNGAAGNNYSGTTFSHSATTPITSGSAPFNGQYQPEESFSAFDGELADGIWILTVEDDGSGDDGTFDSGQLDMGSSNYFSYLLNNGSIGHAGSFANDLILPSSGVSWGSNIHNQSNNALEFDGTNYATTSEQVNPTTGVTMMAWIKPSDVNSDQKVMGIADATNVTDLVSIGVYNGTADFEVREDAGSGRVSMGTLTDDEWVHIAGTWSTADNTVRLYVNGNLVGSTTGPGAPLSFTYPTTTSYYPVFGAAAWNTSSFRFEGSMDDMRTYNKALEAWEIRDLAANFNQHCETAVTLPVEGNTCSANYYAHNFAGNGSSGPATNCDGNIGVDSWFTVTVPASGDVTISSAEVLGSAADDILIEAYAGTCGNLTYLDCNDAGGGFSELPLTGLNPGDVVYVKSWHYNNNNTGQYVMCAFEPISDVNVEELAELVKIDLYPNPASSGFTIEADLESSSDISIVLTNTLGQTVNQVTLENVNSIHHTLNVTDLPDGAYFVTLKGDNIQQTERLIISK